jgi:poly-gamma-glutamate capsule biosynthesis protein CapA/YwtB (metallophosphatase superfamily)
MRIEPIGDGGMGRIMLDGAGKAGAAGEGAEIVLLIGGDLCPIGRNEAPFIAGQPEPLYHDLLPELQAKDLSIFNLECPLTRADAPIRKSGPAMRADPRCAAGLKAGEIDVAVLANNHIMDQGPQGLEETLRACRAQEIETVGAGMDLAQARRPLLRTVRGLRVGLLAMAEHEFSIAAQAEPGAAPLDPIDNLYQMQAIREDVDLLVLLIHGGNEDYPLPSPRVVQVGRFFARMGADLVVWNHIHRHSGLEIYKGVPILYGQGNFIFDEGKQADPWHTGYLARVRAGRKGVRSIELIPYVQSRDRDGAQRLPTPASAALLDEISRLSEIIQDPARLEHEWRAFCAANRETYLRLVYGWDKSLRRRMRRGSPLAKLVPPGTLNVLLNLFQSEAHHDAATEVLRGLYRDG